MIPDLMSRNALTILLLSALALQASLGGLRAGSLVLCLGHASDAHEIETGCSGCDHACDSPLPIPVEDDHGDECGCTDVALMLSDLSHTPRESDDAGVALAVAASIPSGIEVVADAPARAPPRLCSIDPDPGGARRLCALRTTILLI
jgi:hypothetical protein